VGIESTIVSIDEHQVSILRPGVISASRIETHLRSAGLPFEMTQPKSMMAPGQMKHHYMPSIPLILYSNFEMNASEIALRVMEQLGQIPDEVDHVRLVKPAKVEKIEFLHLSDDSFMAARQLYSKLRATADRHPDIICFLVKPIHLQQEWCGVFDRLKKAASLHLA
jgi:L-threonylcarbamoyladenylate synthase